LAEWNLNSDGDDQSGKKTPGLNATTGGFQVHLPTGLGTGSWGDCPADLA
jgi:hypothetical protein